MSEDRPQDPGAGGRRGRGAEDGTGRRAERQARKDSKNNQGNNQGNKQRDNPGNQPANKPGGKAGKGSPQGPGQGAGPASGQASGAGSGKRAARDKRAKQRANERRGGGSRSNTGVVIAVIVVIVVVGIIWYAWRASNNDGPDDAALPALVQESGGGVVLGDGPVEVGLWEDFQCPGCKAFEATNGEMLRERVDAGDVTMTIHPLSFLDAKLSNDSSVLAANAFGCAADVGEQQALEFHLTVYANQPEEAVGQSAWTADDLIGWGNDAGIDGSEWESCVNDLTYDGWVTQVQATMGSEGITATPTIFLDGEKFDVATADLATAIDESLATETSE